LSSLVSEMFKEWDGYDRPSYGTTIPVNSKLLEVKPSNSESGGCLPQQHYVVIPNYVK